MKLIKNLSCSIVLLLTLISCNNGDDDYIIITDPFGDYERGILISNEGPFGSGTGTVSYVSDDYSTNEGTIFSTVNGNDMGNIVQSIGFNGEFAYIVVNNSHKIEVVNRNTFISIASIVTGLDNPRYFVAKGNTGYVTNWGDAFDDSDDYIAIIDLDTNEVSATIPVSFGPEKLILVGNEVYVAHQGGYGQNNLISVINTNTNSLSMTIEVGDVPNSMVIFANDLWVLCGGNPDYTGNETNGSMVKINTLSNKVTQIIDFTKTEHPTNLALDDIDILYNLNGGVYSKEISSTTLPTNSILDGFFYTMVANEGFLYATDAGDFVSNGYLKIFDLSDNTEVESFEVGIIPNGVYFND